MIRVRIRDGANFRQGQKIVALIETPAPVCVEKFADYPQLGRFTLRDEGRSKNLLGESVLIDFLPGKTVAIGKVCLTFF